MKGGEGRRWGNTPWGEMIIDEHYAMLCKKTRLRFPFSGVIHAHGPPDFEALSEPHPPSPLQKYWVFPKSPVDSNAFATVGRTPVESGEGGRGGEPMGERLTAEGSAGVEAEAVGDEGGADVDDDRRQVRVGVEDQRVGAGSPTLYGWSGGRNPEGSL